MRRLASRAFEDFSRGGFSGETILTRTFLRVRYPGVIAWKEKRAAGRAWLSCSCSCCCWFAIVESLELKICGD